MNSLQYRMYGYVVSGLMGAAAVATVFLYVPVVSALTITTDADIVAEAELEATLQNTVAMSADAETETADTETTLSVMVQSGLMTNDLKISVAEFKGPMGEIVQSKEDVDAYASLVAEANPVVERIVLTQSALEVSYDERGYLFWILPVNLTSKVVVDTEGTVIVDRPWYAFLVRPAEDAETLETNVGAKLGANSSASIRAFAANALAVDQVELMRAVVAGIEESVEAEAEVATE